MVVWLYTYMTLDDGLKYIYIELYLHWLYDIYSTLLIMCDVGLQSVPLLVFMLFFSEVINSLYLHESFHILESCQCIILHCDTRVIYVITYCMFSSWCGDHVICILYHRSYDKLDIMYFIKCSYIEYLIILFVCELLNFRIDYLLS